MRVTTFILCCMTAGCASQSTPAPFPDTHPAVTRQQLGEALARRIEATDPAGKLTSQHVYKMARLATERAGMTVDLGPVPNNVDLSARDRAEWIQRFRGWR
jgi:hypothetical protein